jgi:hypothetical protein
MKHYIFTAIVITVIVTCYFKLVNLIIQAQQEVIIKLDSFSIFAP